MKALDILIADGLPDRVCFVGLGNPALGDDGLGVRLAEDLLESGIPTLDEEPQDGRRNDGPPDSRLRSGFCPRPSAQPTRVVLVAGTTPERHLGRLTEGAFEHVVLLDAVDFGGAPGSAVLLGATEIAERFPQVSTHRISLGTLARLIESQGRTKAWLLGVQPESLRPGTTLTRRIQQTRDMLSVLCRATRSEVAR